MSDTMTDDDWTPVMHEAMPEAQSDAERIKVGEYERARPKPRERSDAEPKEKDARPTGAAMSLPLALMLPQEVLDRVDAVVSNIQDAAKVMQETAQGLDEGMAVLADLSAKDEVEDLRESMSQAHGGVTEAIKAMSVQYAAASAQMSDVLTALVKQVGAMATVVEANSRALAEMQSAAMAPRKVTLKRDKDGFATEAVSEVSGPTIQ